MITNTRGSALLSAQASQVTGSGFDARNAGGAAFMSYFVTGNSAVFDLQAAADNLRYLTFATFTAAANTTGSANYSAFYPWVRAVARSIASAAGGSAQVSIYWQGCMP